MAKRKLSKKQLKKLHAKKKTTKGFSIWAHQTYAEEKLKKVQKKNPKGLVWEGFTANETKGEPKGSHATPEF